MYMPYTGCGKVINYPNFLATMICSIMDSKMSVRVWRYMDHIVHDEGKHHANCFKSVPCLVNVQRQNHYFWTQLHMYMPCNGCGYVFNYSTFLATSIWTMLDSKTLAQGVEMSKTPRIPSYTIGVNIMWLLFLTCASCGSPQAYWTWWTHRRIHKA